MKSAKLIRNEGPVLVQPLISPPNSRPTRIEVRWLEEDPQPIDCHIAKACVCAPIKARAPILMFLRCAILGQSSHSRICGNFLFNSISTMNTILEPPNAKDALAPEVIQSPPPHRILMVEDDPDILRISAKVLIRDGYQVITAEDGLVGWKTLRANKFDLVITDHNMPKLTGLELVTKIRRANMTVPVILASGSLPTEELERHPWLQLAATLLKPFTNSQLLETVKSALRNAGSSDEGISNLVNSRQNCQHWGVNE
jgi:CheY-like chemotaxis protein